MSGSGYDGHLVLSPEGRIFQVEYAMKAIEFTTTVLGIQCKDGIVFAAERQIMSKLHESSSIPARRIFNIDTHIGCAMAGLLTDSRALVDYARGECTSFRDKWDAPIPVDVLAKRISSYMFQHTIYNGARPFGCAMILGGYNESSKKHELWMCEPAGVCWRYKGVSLGKTKQATKTELEKIDPKLGEISVADGLKNAVKVVQAVRDENNSSKTFAIDLSFIGGDNGNRHRYASDKLRKECEEWATQQLDSDDSEEDDEDDDEEM